MSSNLRSIDSERMWKLLYWNPNRVSETLRKKRNLWWERTHGTGSWPPISSWWCCSPKRISDRINTTRLKWYFQKHKQTSFSHPHTISSIVYHEVWWILSKYIYTRWNCWIGQTPSIYFTSSTKISCKEIVQSYQESSINDWKRD
jgi:hypothetical protein